MPPLRPLLLAAALAAACGAMVADPDPAAAAGCRRPAAPAAARSNAARAGCGTTPAARKPKPERDDPPALQAGQRPGFIDLGGGTELRVGGRVRLEMDHQR